VAEDPHLRHKLGISRRDLIRRGAIVGGTLIWTVPVVTTLSKNEAAAGSSFFSCCICKSSSGNYLGNGCKPAARTNAECASACAPKPYEFHTSPSPITCTDSGAQAGRGCSSS
jgi:hypothetical protein